MCQQSLSIDEVQANVSTKSPESAKGLGKVDFPLLRTLAVKDFRSLVDVQLPLKPLNIIIGPNASGKSNLFKALRYLQDVVVEEKWAEYDKDSKQLLWYGKNGSDVANEFLIELTIELPEQKGGYSPNYQVVSAVSNAARSKAGRVHILSERLKLKLTPSASEPIDFIQRKHTNGWRYIKTDSQDEDAAHSKYAKIPIRGLLDRVAALNTYTREETFPAVKSMFDFIHGWRFFQISPHAARRSTPWEAQTIPPLANDGSNLSAFLYALSKYDPETFDEIQDRLSRAIGLPEKVETTYVPALVGHGEIRLSFQERPFPGVAIPPESMSDGTILLLTYLALLLGDPNASLICIEEPDHGLHPTLMLRLADILRSVVEVEAVDDPEYDLIRPQIIITTHSTDFLDCFDLEAEADYLQVFTVERSDEDGKSVFIPIKATEIKPWLDEYRLGELVRQGVV